MCLQSVMLLACECPPVAPVNQETLKGYDIIFSGKIDSVSPCGTNGIAIAYFTIDELYKGKTMKQTAVHFDCLSSCMMSMAKNENWIIYANYRRFDLISVKLCSHSRKYFQASENDIYLSTAQRTYGQEKDFLNSTLGIQTFIKEEVWNSEQQELKPHNKQPSNFNKIILLLVSFGVMILVYIITRKKKKKNG